MDREYRTCRVVIGKGTRRSSYISEYTLAAGLTASGADAHLLHVAITLSVPYVVRTEGFDCGVMISTSHNPYYDNGIELTNTQGEEMNEDTILQVGVYLDDISGKTSLAVRERIGRTVGYVVDWNRYTGYLTSLATRFYKNMKMGLDCVNGSAWMIVRSMLDALGVSTYVVNNEPDGLNINIGCGPTHMEGLIRFMKEKKPDVSFAFDGGADRCLCTNEEGDLIDGDLILYIYGRYIKEREKLAGDKIVTTVTSSFGLHGTLDEAGIEYEKTAVGDKCAYENMALSDYRIGGEQSGHTTFRKYTTTGDGTLIAIRIVEVILGKKRPLNRFAESTHIYPQVFENIRVEDKQAVKKDRDVQDTVNRAEQGPGTEGRVLVKESDMGPIMRVMAEARDGRKCREYMGRIVRAMVDKGHQGVLS